MKSKTPLLYDQNEYYADNARGSRLAPVFDLLLYVLELSRLGAVLRFLSSSTGKVLDVGAGDGKFLHFMQRRGFSPYGATLSERSAKAAEAQFGVKLNVTPDLNVFEKEAPFVLISYWHVFEHLSDPQAHVLMWPKLLAHGGLIVIEVPNIESFGAKLCYSSWLGSDPVHHINHQAPAKIRADIEKLGLKVIDESYFSLKFSYVFLWSAVLGSLFTGVYGFDAIMDALKKPLASFRTRKLATANLFASVFYLAPVVLILAIAGLVARRGEVYTVYAKQA